MSAAPHGRRAAAAVRGGLAARLAAVLLAAALLAVAVPPVAAQPGADVVPAQPQGEEGDPLRVELRAVDAVLDPADPEAAATAELLLASGDRQEDLRLVTSAHERLEDRTALQRAAGGELGAVFSAVAVDLADLPAGGNRVLTSTVTAAQLSLARADRAGVYPLSYQVFQGSTPVAAVHTWAVVLPEDLPDPLPATTVVRLADAGVPPMAGDVAGPEVEAAVAPGSPLVQLGGQLAEVAADGSAAGVALVADGRLLQDLDGLADGWLRPDGSAVGADDRAARRAGAVLGSARSLARRSDVGVVAMPYGPADLVALVRGGEPDAALDLVEVGEDRVAQLLGTGVADQIAAPPDGLDADALAVLGEVGAEAVLLDAGYLSFAADESLRPVRRLRTADGGEVRLLVPDADLSALLADPRGVGTAAVTQQLLAETAVRWLAGDGGDPGAGVLLAADPLTTGAVDLAAITAALADAPWIRPVGLAQLAELRPAERVVRLAYPPRARAQELGPLYVQQLGRARDALGPLAELLPEEDQTAAVLAEQLLAAGSIAYRPPGRRPQGQARIDAVLDRLGQVRGHVEVLASAPVTLTATTGEVPVTLVNSGDEPVAVAVHVASTRFDFPSDRQEVVLQPQSATQLLFAARARTPGGFAPVSVAVTDPTGARTLTQTQISVRSAAVPVVGLLAIGGSGLVLLWWGVRQLLRRRGGGVRRRTAGAEEQATVA